MSLSTARAGSFSETLTLDPTGGNASGFSAPLGADTVIVTGKVAAPTGLAHGDVHMVTFDGLHYDFQATGDFVLARATDPANAYQIQIHTSTLRGIAGISYTTQIAAELGGGQRVNLRRLAALWCGSMDKRTPRWVSAHRKRLPMAACFCGYRRTATN